MYREKVGIIGGFGAYATLNFYKRLLEEFASESERNYPHIIMDNNFTMPSRTRALLYGEAYDEVVDGISDSIQLMLQNCPKIHCPLKIFQKRQPAKTDCLRIILWAGTRKKLILPQL